jgi:hypothetical protein
VLLIHGLNDRNMPPYHSGLIRPKTRRRSQSGRCPAPRTHKRSKPRRKNSSGQCCDGSRSTRRPPCQRVARKI